jgi:hypothetical protein
MIDTPGFPRILSGRPRKRPTAVSARLFHGVFRKEVSNID